MHDLATLFSPVRIGTLRERIPEVHAVGDCTGLGLNQKATLEGARAACAL